MSEDKIHPPTDKNQAVAETSSETMDADGEQAADEEPSQDDAGVKSAAERSSTLWAGTIGVSFWVLMMGSFAYTFFGLGAPELEIVVTASPKYNATDKTLEDWSVSGHVIYNNEFVKDFGVWAIAVDQQGNRRSTGKILTDKNGKFDLGKIPNSLSGQPDQTIVEIAVHASGKDTAVQGKDDKTVEVKSAITRVGIGTGQRYRVINLPIKELVVIGLIFALSVAVALIPVPQGSKTTAWLVAKYLSSVVFAFLLTGFMVLYISLGLRHVNQTASNVENEILSLGVANIYKGRYVDDVPNEWLISLTSPSFAKAIDSGSEGTGTEGNEKTAGGEKGEDKNTANQQSAGGKVQSDSPEVASVPTKRQLERGFGAPLWVVLVAVIGSALFTISIVLVGIKEAPLELKPEEIRTRIQAVVLHQFYILFAPIGAIFVYQLLVIAGAASQAVSVAVIALAAGIALNVILEKARTRVENLISKAE